MPELSYKHINAPGQLPFPPYNLDDGIGVAQNGQMFNIHHCIVDLSSVPLSQQDGGADVTYGSSAIFENCWFRGTGKLSLLGSGDEDHRKDEEGKLVTFVNCIFEDFGRRGPEVQCGMRCTLDHCWIRNWGHPDFFSVRAFAAWAHDDGMLVARDCVFENENNMKATQRLADHINHISQAVKDNGIKALFDSKTYMAGWKRGLTTSDSGIVSAHHCFADDGVLVENNDEPMSADEAARMKLQWEKLKEVLKKTCK